MSRERFEIIEETAKTYKIKSEVSGQEIEICKFLVIDETE